MGRRVYFTPDYPLFFFIFFNDNGIRPAFLRRLSDLVFVFIRNLIHFDKRLKLILIVSEDLGTHLVAVAIAHAQFVDMDLHENLLWVRISGSANTDPL